MLRLRAKGEDPGLRVKSVVRLCTAYANQGFIVQKDVNFLAQNAEE